jgi:hypothetical protein
VNHSLFEYLIMWAASFALVFLLGIQSKNVQRSRYLAAVITSFGISVGNFTFVKYASAGTLDAFWACALGGCMGIAVSIWVSDHVLHKRHLTSPQPAGAVFRSQIGSGHTRLLRKRQKLEQAGREAMRVTFGLDRTP